MRRSLLVVPLIFLSACSSPPPEKPVAKAEPSGPDATTTSKNPVAKFIELAGFRLTETSPNKLKIVFDAINHSEADLEELQVHVRLMARSAKEGDEPVAEFDAKIPALGPEQDHDVTTTATTKLRVYEMPDWQFLRAEFDITSPSQ